MGGGGRVSVSAFRDEEIVLKAEPDAHGVLRLNVGYFPKWRATRDGTPVPITPLPVPNVESAVFMQVPLAPGTYRFRYHRTASDYVGTLLCLAGLTACGFLAFGDRIPQNRVLGALRQRFAVVNPRRVGY